MAKLLKLRRGTTSQHGSFTGAEGEVTVDTDKETLVVHDGSTAGGHPVAAEDMANVSSASIAGRLGTDSIATTKIAAGALPTDVTVTDTNINGNLTIESADIVDGTIVNADINASAAIAGSKITPNFGSQNIATTGTASTGQITVKGAQEPQLVLQDSDTGNTGNAAETGISFRDGGGTQQSMIGHNNSGDKDFYLDTAGSDHRINFRVGASTTQLEIESSAVNVTGNITATGDLTITSAVPTISLTDSGNNPDYEITNTNGALNFKDTTNNSTKISVQSAATLIANNLDCGDGVDVTGTCTATTFSGSGASLTTLNASNLSSGTIPDARFPATLPAISGANLTGITSFVSGMIIMYNSASAPSGWYLCDGNNGTPDLRDRFIVGAGNSYSQGATGGSNTATDTISISGSDTVSISISGTTSAAANNNNATYGLGSVTSHARNDHTHTFSGTGTDTVNISGSDTASIDTRSPYYALTFIMKA
jgi:hypothetical protein